MPDHRTVFFISDRTGITAEMLGSSLLTQFEDIRFRRITIPFVDSVEKVADAVRQVNATAAAEGKRPIVVSSVVDEAMSEMIRRDADALTLDMFQIFIQPLEAELGAKSSHAAGRSHGVANSHEYFARMEAINFTQSHDDGAITRDLDKAQVILVGVSRCGKTPTSLYLALQFGVRAANFPLTPDDFADRRLPASVMPHRERLFGLTIQAERLRDIREERRPGSRYATIENCRHEIREAEHLMQQYAIPMLDTTSKSIEEIATTVLHRAKLARHAY
ncbi:MAG: kinase/pyrophosphorylase [Betaproteobacteria bacterium]|nr:kinase/pyrophosphorylase [Betaproteobacteria bacterium]MDE2208928.1 kinase/pyrophosphorylase [Betaproteobacteria bacterium]MDE2360023.1 kinase/pyrophosphorylase [Betaproteobacteria bacterium]